MKNKILGYAIGPIGSALLGLITLPLLTWFFSIEDIGRISMLQVTASFCVLLFCLGLDQAYTREYHETQNKPKLFKQCVAPGAILILLATLIILSTGLDQLSIWLYDIPNPYLAIVSLLFFLLTFFSRFLSLILRMEDRAVAYSMSQLLPKLLFVLLIVCSVWLGYSKDIYNLITAHTLSITAVFLIYTWNTRDTWLAAITTSFDWVQNKALLSFGLPLVIGGLASWGLNVMDKLFLRSMSTFAELGVYSVTMSIAGVATIFAGIFNTIWAPMVYKWVKEGADLKKVDEISEHLLAAIYFIVVLAGLFSWILPYFLPKEYAAIEYLITLCLIAPLFYTLSETTAVGISISRKTGFSMLASIGAMLINVIGNYLLVPKIGATGAAISTAFSFWVFYILRTELARRVWRNMPSVKTYLIITILLSVVVIKSLFLDQGGLLLFIWIGMFFIGFFIFNRSIKMVKEVLLSQYAK